MDLRNMRLRYTSALLLPLFCGVLHAQDSAGAEYFEKHVRPVLATKCNGCHNSSMKTPLGGLRVDSRDGLRKGGDSGPAIQPGDPDASRLIQAISYKHDLKMPPAGKLPDSDIDRLREWVKMGAPDPREDKAAKASAPAGSTDFQAARKFWSFQPVRKPAIPKAANPGWVQSPVDAFVLAKLRDKGLTPAPQASRRELIRRVSFDLTGLPPTPAEVEAFVADKSPEAWSRLVDRLLASPHYAERQARHWLDLVRYAETNGHEYDNDKHEPWRYRDYVIRAFHEDVPYDQFVREHIAGDLLPEKRLRKDGGAWESPLGTTQFWFGEVLNSATDSVKSRADDVDNQIDVLSKTFLGLTVACARCHDHKFDPLPTADYYSLAGVLHSTEMRETTIDSPKRTAIISGLSARIREINRQMGEPKVTRGLTSLRPEDKPFESFAAEAGFGKWVSAGAAFGEAPMSRAVDSRAAGSDVFSGTLTSPKFRTGTELFLHVRIGGSKADPALKERGPLRFTIIADGYKGQHIVPDGTPDLKWKTLRLTFERERICKFEIVDRSRTGHIIVDEIVFSTSSKPPVTSADEIVDADVAAPRAAELQAEKKRLEEQVPDSEFAMVAEDHEPRNVHLHIRGNHKNLGNEVPRGYLQLISAGRRSPVLKDSGRLAVAEWLASPENPLTARVMANRLWAQHFGAGLVRSTDNFGKMGEAPSHPELLDYLAGRFVESGWSVKALHREMLLSSTYRMSSKPSEAAQQVDPNNRLLQHMPVRRLEAEAIRDAVLAVSGRLDRALYGPSIAPHISEYQHGRGRPASGPLDGDGRRSLYIQVRRNFMTPMFLAFDYPVPISTIGARTSSTVPSQALMMMNNEFLAQQAQRWAAAATSSASNPEERVGLMYRQAFSREPEQHEVAQILDFVRSQTRNEQEVWADVAHVLLNTAEFIYIQ
ncbi:MAG TPA: PSD1 and planctomycete cytochrome C domain-containing protein [Bryobacteraceae bacterium]|nr:PSD1 and planctomycete cytochrome C domain-containing protein [Bryobacteraceae bacterium]